MDIKLYKYLSSIYLGQRLIQQGQRIAVFTGYIIKLTVVNTEAKSSVQLFYKENRGGKQGLARLNKPLYQVFHNILLSSLQFGNRLFIKGGIAKDIFLIQFDLNLIVVRLVRQKYVGCYLREYVLKLSVLIGQFPFYQLLIYKLAFLSTKFAFFILNYLINFVQASSKSNGVRLNQIPVEFYSANIADINQWEVRRFLYGCLLGRILRYRVYSLFQLIFYFP